MSTTDYITAIEGSTVAAPAFTKGLTIAGTDIRDTVKQTEYYYQEETPSGAQDGAIWWTGSILYQFINDRWRILTITPPLTWYGTTALFGGGNGYLNTIESITTTTPGNAVDFGDLTVGRLLPATASNSTRGVWAGGYTGSSSNVIDYVTIATPGNAIDFGDLSQANWSGYGAGNGTKGAFTGRYSNNVDVITIDTLGNATTQAFWGGKENPAMMSDNSLLISLGDSTTSGSYITYYSWADLSGSAVASLALSRLRFAMGACSNFTYGIIGSGYAGTSGGAYTSTNDIEYIVIATLGNLNFFGDLSTAINSPGAASDGTRAIFQLGQTIEYVTIATTSNSTDFGDLLSSRTLVAGLSGN